MIFWRMCGPIGNGNQWRIITNLDIQWLVMNFRLKLAEHFTRKEEAERGRETITRDAKELLNEIPNGRRIIGRPNQNRIRRDASSIGVTHWTVVA